MDVEFIKECILYCPNTGDMRWKRRPESHFKSKRGHSIWTARYEGKPVGCLRTLKSGYTNLVFSLKMPDGKERTILCHRAAWAIMTGDRPPKKVDHINRDATDNRWENLRDGTGSVNERNAYLSRANTSGVSGVSWNKQHRKWEAYVACKGKKINLGIHSDISDAARAVSAARKELGFSPDHGAPRPESPAHHHIGDPFYPSSTEHTERGQTGQKCQPK